MRKGLSLVLAAAMIITTVSPALSTEATSTINENLGVEGQTTTPEAIASDEQSATTDAALTTKTAVVAEEVKNTTAEGISLETNLVATEAGISTSVTSGTAVDKIDLTTIEGIKLEVQEEAIEPLFISELCDPKANYEKDRFIEIYNPTDEKISLTGWKIEEIENDKVANTFELNGEIEAKGTYVVSPQDNGFADVFNGEEWGSFNGKDGDGAKLYKNNILIDESKLTLENSTAIRKVNIVEPKAKYNEMEWEFISCDSIADTTPGTHRAGIELKEQVRKPKFDPYYTNIYLPYNIKISSDTKNASIYYTINEAFDKSKAMKYTAPIRIDKASVIRAVAVKDGMEDSNISELNITAAETHGSISQPKSVSDIINGAGVGEGKVDAHEWIYIKAKIEKIEGSKVTLINPDGSEPDKKISFDKAKAPKDDARVKEIVAKAKVGDIFIINAKYFLFNNNPEFANGSLSNIVGFLENDLDQPTIDKINVAYCSINRGMSVNAEIKDNAGVQKVDFYYQKNGESTFKSKEMYYKDGRYQVFIAREEIKAESIHYYIQAQDTSGNEATSEKKVSPADTMDWVLPLKKVIVEEGKTLKLPTEVSFIQEGNEKKGKVTWAPFNHTKVGEYVLEGQIEGTKEIAKIDIVIEGVLKIHEIQGNTSASPYIGKEVIIEGIVTGWYSYSKDKFMYIQEEDADADNDPNTSEGILVLGADKLEVGTLVKLRGRVDERSEKLQSSYLESLSTTVIKFPKIIEKSKDIKPLPTPVVINSQNVVPERIFDASSGANVEDGNRILQPRQNAIDFYEALESMRVEIELPKVVGFAEKYGNIYVVPSKGQGYKGFTANGGIKANPDYHYGNVMTLDFSLDPIKDKEGTFKEGYSFGIGDQYESNITGIVRYQFGDYKITYDCPKSIKDIPKIKGQVKRSVTKLIQEENKLTIASYNIENFTGKAPQKKVDDVADSIVNNLKLPDIIGLVEVQDNDGEGGSSPAANQSYEKLIAAIKEKSGLSYAYTQIDPVHDADGGAPNSNIRVGFLYNPTRVMKSDAPQGAGDSMTEAQMVQVNGKWVLANNPARLGTHSPVFIKTRKSLVACFNFKGEDIYIIGNHFSSKRGETGPFGNVQPPNVNPAERIAQAQLINDFVEKEILGHNPAAKVIVLGDMNDFEYSLPVKALEGKQLYNLHNKLPENERYTYIHSGLSQTLDHILVTKGMANITEFEPVHMNAEFSFADGRASDHDALMARINFDKKVPPVPNVPSSGDRDSSSSKTETNTKTQDIKPKPPVIAPNNVDGFIKQLQDLKAANKKLTATEAMDQLKGMLSKENLNNLKALNPANYNQVMLAALSYGQELLMAGGRQDVSQKATVVSGQKVFNISKEMLKGGLSKSEALYKEMERVSKEQAKKLAPVALIDLGDMSLKDNVKVTLEGLSEVNGQVRIASNQMQMLLAESLRPEQLVIESQPVSAEIQSQLAAKKGFTGFVRDISLRAGNKALTPDQMPWVSFSISEAIQKGFDPNKLAVFIFDPASQSYERVSSTRIGDTLNFKAPHFSIYTIMENHVSFKDMNKHWAKEAVEVLGAKAIVNGDAAGNFEPSRQITRAEFTAMLVNALDLKADTQANFKDVESKAWYSQQIAAAKAKGLVTGNEKGEFKPNEAITRQEMAALVARAYQIDKGLALVGEGVSFTDQTNIASYAQEAVQGAQYYHLISGYKDGSFKPKAKATRAEAAKVIYQLITLN